MTNSVPSRSASVLVIGESLIDILSDSKGESFHPGGSPFNVARGLGGFGFAVRLHTQLGEDVHGRTLHSILSSAGVQMSAASLQPGPSSTAAALIASDGSASYDFKVSWDIAPPVLQGETWVHIGSVGAFLSPGADRVLEFVEHLPEQVLLSFDPNIRSALIGPREANFARFEQIARRADLIKMSDEDAEYLFPGLTPEQALERLSDQSDPGLAVVTRGAQGAIAAQGTRRYSCAATATKVVDTIGAGDSFMVGLIGALLTLPQGLRRLRSSGLGDDLFRVLEFASACSAFTVARAGAQMPGRGVLSLHSLRGGLQGPASEDER